MKYDVETKRLNDKIKDLTLKNEEMVKELNTKNLENTFNRFANRNFIYIWEKAVLL